MGVITLLCSSPCCALPGQHQPEPEDGHDDTCRGCQPARAADGLYLCQRCTAGIGRDAFKAAELHGALGQVLAGGGGRGESGPGGASTGVELHPVAVEARGAIRATLVGLCRLVAEERGLGLPADDVVDMARYLARHAQWLAAHRAAGEHAAELRDVATDARSFRVAYAVAGDRTLIGLCNQPGTALSVDPDGLAEVCGARLWWRGEDLVECPGCGRAESVQWWRWELCSVADGREVVDAYEAAAFLSWRWGREVQPGLVWQWGRRYDDAGMLRTLVRATGRDGRLLLGPVEPIWAEGKPLKDRQGRVLFVLGLLVGRAERMWGAPTGVLTQVGG